MGLQEKRGVLVALEGIDGAGKTTQVDRLAAELRRLGIPHIVTKEPTDGPWGRKIRESARTERMPPDDELAAFLADRREHVRDVLRPAIASGKVVVVDRYFLSTVAYQGARGFNPSELLAQNSFALAPDLMLILDVPPLEGLRRVRARGDSADLFESESQLAAARRIFRSVRLPNLHLLDGCLAVEELADAVFQLTMIARVSGTWSGASTVAEISRETPSSVGIAAPAQSGSPDLGITSSELALLFDRVLREPQSQQGLAVDGTADLLATRVREHSLSHRQYLAAIAYLTAHYLDQFLHSAINDPTLSASIEREMRARMVS